MSKKLLKVTTSSDPKLFLFIQRKMFSFQYSFWELILGALGLFLVISYCWILDDAFIYFRYIDNFLFRRIGLVFNQGEFVEGFTSPLWALLLSGIRWLGFDFLSIVSVISPLLFLIFLALLIYLNSLWLETSVRLNLPLLSLAVAYGPTSYFSSGVETPLVQISAVVLAIYILRPSKWGEIFLGLMPLIRPELSFPLLLGFLWRWHHSRSLPWFFLAVILIPNSIWILFRIFYYADLFPNTFYVKNIYWPAQGLLYLKDTFFSYGFVITVMLGVVALVFHLISCGGTTWSKSPERLYMGLVAIVVIAYVVKIGGDAFHYRYLAFSYVLLLCSLGGSLEILFIQAVSGFYKYLIVTLAIFSCAWAFLGVPRQLEKHPLYFPNVRTKIVDRIEDGPCFHRSWPIIKQFSKWRFKLTPEQIESGPAEGIGYNRKKILTIVTAAMFYQKIFNYGIQAPGFADRDLAFINVSAARPGHKPAVRPYLHDIEGLIESGLPRERGMYRKAVENGIASKWMLRNLHTLEKLEKRTFNQHLFFANLKLAFMRIDRIEPREDDFQLVRHVSLNQ